MSAASLLQTLYEFILWILEPWWMKKWSGASSSYGTFRESDHRCSEQLPAIGPHSVIVHAAGIGDFLGVFPLLLAIQRDDPQRPILCTTMENETYRLAGAYLAPYPQMACCFLPYDRTRYVQKFLRKTQPTHLFLVGKELWPTLLQECQRHTIPAFLLHGQLTHRSFLKYKRWFHSPIPAVRRWCRFPAHSLAHLFVPKQEDRERWQGLGIEPTKITVCGAIKSMEPRSLCPTLERLLQELTQGRFVWVAGSTYATEERLLLSVQKRLRQRKPNALLILAPRYIARCSSIANALQRSGWCYQRLSQARRPMPPIEVLLVDQVGLLAALYAFGEVCFVGGSLVDKGGHNPLEAARWSRRFCMGPYQDHVKAVLKPFGNTRFFATIRSAQDLVDQLLAKPLDHREEIHYQQILKELTQSNHSCSLEAEVLSLLRRDRLLRAGTGTSP